MSKPLVPTREVVENGIKRRQYLCHEDGWVFGSPWDGTGYTEYLCPDCDRTLDSDPYGTFEAEKMADLEE